MKSLDYDIEPDVSAACYFYAMSPLLHVKSKVMGVHQNSLQGDVAFLDVLADMGCTISDEADGIVCMPPKNAHIDGGSWDLSTFSDQGADSCCDCTVCKGACRDRRHFAYPSAGV